MFEINPRFPAWISFAVKTGMNLPAYSAAQALGMTPPALSDCPAGKMFLRNYADIVADITLLADLGIDSELTAYSSEHKPEDSLGHE